MHPLSIFGTSSDAGKTTLVMALCRLFTQKGYKVAPFKAQNVSNNAAVAEDNLEISRAQFFQAEAARIPPTYHLNPILLKPQGNGIIQLILNGQVFKTTDVATYYQELDNLKQHVKTAFEYLASFHDIVIAEGAGSPVELNLLHKDLSNTYIAKTFNSKIVLVADIEKGGVFASIYGTAALLDEQLRNNLVGVVINKFRGDMRFFDEGRKIIEKQFSLPVLGVLPYLPFNIHMEDSLSLKNYQQNIAHEKLFIGVIAYPGMSNYDDLDPLIADSEVRVEIIQKYQSLANFDALLLLGTKTTIQDLKWLKNNGLFKEILQFKKQIFGICGGYQMLFNVLKDPDAIEYPHPIEETGLGLIDDNIQFYPKKILTRTQYQAFGLTVTGYETHMAQTAKYPLFYEEEKVAGTHIHGIFENDEFRNTWCRKINSDYQGYAYQDYREHQIQTFVNHVATHINYEKILAAL